MADVKRAQVGVAITGVVNRFEWYSTLVTVVRGSRNTSDRELIEVEVGRQQFIMRRHEFIVPGHRIRHAGVEFEIDGVADHGPFSTQVMVTCKLVQKTRNVVGVDILIGGVDIDVGGVDWFIAEEE